MKKMTFFLLAAFLLMAAEQAPALPLPLGGEYTVVDTTTNTGLYTWKFTYQVTNNNQQNSYSRTGLDGFMIQIPDSANILNVVSPASFTYGGSWVNNISGSGPFAWAADPALAQADPGFSWLVWWGLEEASVYPMGKTATFSVELSNVTVGQNTGMMVTYWARNGAAHGEETWSTTYGTEYTSYHAELVSPVAAVPEPATLLLFGTGLIGLAGVCRRKK